MKKLLIISMMLVFLTCITMVTAVPLKNKELTVLVPDGSFSGFIGYPRHQDPIILGNISGFYKLRNRGGAFNASWNIETENHSGSGTVRGIFGRHILLGRLSAEGYNQTLPIIGFIGFNTENLTFIGRAMSYIGPALYFWGTYQPF
ncbi:MAG: hypothetical protein QHH15_05150 [Candidatus Thermoplasmatota archaeon]|jgi:hypothetical protein|nr:hypothetical protein [Candidatus Thermoplasmatota archaeon]